MDPNPTPKPKICIYGAGAIGCHLAGHLARTGKAVVSVVAQPHSRTVSAISQNGIRVITPREDFTARVQAVGSSDSDIAALGIQDYVIITLKIQQQTAAVLRTISQLVGPNTTILPPSTGIPYYFFHGFAGAHDDERLPEIDPDGVAWQVLPPSQVIPVVFWCGAHRLAPNVTQQDGSSARYAVGELAGHSGDSKRLTALVELMQAGGLDITVTDNIRGEIWTKFANSLCGNPIAVLTLADMSGFATEPAVVAVFAAMLREVDAVGAALSVHVPQSVEDRLAFTLSTGHHQFSMLQDLEAGHPLELDSFIRSWDAVKRLAGSGSGSGPSTPTCDVVLPLAELRNRRYEEQLQQQQQ
ncbi:hypothetical protein A1O3_10191 [Capronia epimyces CBS 606.96]|uniref:2-dehydropantoate 2-reductase n=1 Tax=Capronia epimyces CBS 606.96 TaxID=1182542 RepID=W9Y3K0_9EURO|nr:uncharacterized protein A1O3_10191 [Capronia epimyces CBS 606.96]EXJ77034.1 hypothetical protein A1O3_10191 [Capronia epimyces CBS 606.96]